MRSQFLLSALLLILCCAFFSFKRSREQNSYLSAYLFGLDQLAGKARALKEVAQKKNVDGQNVEELALQLASARQSLKAIDFWLRYLEPVSYKKINGPLPVEWETEVFEKFEKPYRREGSGLTLFELYLEEDDVQKDSLLSLAQGVLAGLPVYKTDSIVQQLSDPSHFYFANRLFLLNLAAIYTTGFECPDSEKILPELKSMLLSVKQIYKDFDAAFPEKALNEDYHARFEKMLDFVSSQGDDYSKFDHLGFIRDHVNPLFTANQQFIRGYALRSRSYVDYSINNHATSIFSKALYNGQNAKGIYRRLQDKALLEDIAQTGRLLFYDPILSGNNQRSCASCHKPDQYFTDTTARSAFVFNRSGQLERNSPSLLNAPYNHLLMYDGAQLTLQDQVHSVITNTAEMSCASDEMLKKIMSCTDYKKSFKRFAEHTPWEPEVSVAHIASAITLYYQRFSFSYSEFDRVMNHQATADETVHKGFNLFMGKAQCATCHFVPQFNGVKPPYIGSEFEVLGVPRDTGFTALSPDKGRYKVHAAPQTLNAFRTGSIRNIEKTKPYMHNGVFNDLAAVIDFYDAGGGAGRGLNVPNQTLSGDSLHLSADEKKQLLAFMRSLNEDFVADVVPSSLPLSKNKTLNNRKPGGDY